MSRQIIDMLKRRLRQSINQNPSSLEFVVLLVPTFESLWAIFIVKLFFTFGKANVGWLGIKHDTNLRND
jgi:hypothetical protein